MRILRRGLLSRPRITQDRTAWETITRAATWAGAADVIRSHPTAVNIRGKTWRFPLPNDGQDIEALVNFVTGDVSIQSIS